MAETNFLKDAHVLIWGLGLMGGSLALALKGKCAWMTGIDPDIKTAAMALEMHAVDEVFVSLQDCIHKKAEVIILAAPVRGILGQLKDLAGAGFRNAVVLDLGSTKSQIVSIMENLPDGLDPVGGHPMCGSEKSSILHAHSGIYQNAMFALVQTKKTTERAVKVCEQLVRAVEAVPCWLDAETHDRWVAATSSLPFLIANALAATVPTEARPLVGPGFQSTSRLAVESIDMMLDILHTNRGNVLSVVETYQQRLLKLQNALNSNNETELRRLLQEGARQRDALMDNLAEGQSLCN